MLQVEAATNQLRETVSDIASRWRSAEHPGTNRFLLDIVAAASILILFAYINWLASGPEIPYDYIWKAVKPFQSFPETGIHAALESGWGVSGKQFFLFPLFAVTGVSPFILKTVSVAVYALAGVLLYLAISRKFDRYTGITVSLLFISIRAFAKWRNGDMYLFFFLSMLFLYLYVRWEDDGKPVFLHAMALVAGFGIYVKTLMIYPVAALAMSTVLHRHDRLTSLSPHEAVRTGAFFVLGALPLLVYSVGAGFSNWRLARTIRQFPGIMEGITARIPQFFKITAPVQPLAEGVMQQSPHVYTILFLTGAILCLVRRQDIVYLSAFLFSFLFSLFTPQAGLPVHQLMIIYPFFLVVTAQNSVALKRIHGLHRATPLAAGAVLVITGGLLTNGVVHPGSVTIEEHQSFSQIDISGTVAVNNRHAFALTLFTPDVTGRVLAPDNWTYRFFVGRENQISTSEAVNRYRNGTLSLVLLADGRCGSLFYGAPRCGYATDTILTAAGLTASDGQTVDIGRDSYLIVRPESP